MLSTLRTGKSNGGIWLLALHQRCSTDVLRGYKLQQSHLLTGLGTTAPHHTETLLMEEKRSSMRKKCFQLCSVIAVFLSIDVSIGFYRGKHSKCFPEYKKNGENERYNNIICLSTLLLWHQPALTQIVLLSWCTCVQLFALLLPSVPTCTCRVTFGSLRTGGRNPVIDHRPCRWATRLPHCYCWAHFYFSAAFNKLPKHSDSQVWPHTQKYNGFKRKRESAC